MLRNEWDLDRSNSYTTRYIIVRLFSVSTVNCTGIDTRLSYKRLNGTTHSSLLRADAFLNYNDFFFFFYQIWQHAYTVDIRSNCEQAKDRLFVVIADYDTFVRAKNVCAEIFCRKVVYDGFLDGFGNGLGSLSRLLIVLSQISLENPVLINQEKIPFNVRF